MSRMSDAAPGPRRHRRRRQLRLVLRAGPLLLSRGAAATSRCPGLMHVELGGYHVGDIEVSAAFDVSAAKVGRDVAEAIFAEPNNTQRFAEVPDERDHRPARPDPRRARQVPARRDRGIGRAPRPTSPRSCGSSGTDVLVSYLPVGSQQATEWYAEQALEAGCAFVNCIPVFIASRPGLAPALRGARAADHRRRHQEPGRRHHRPPRARQPVPRARRAARPHLPAQFRRQHRLPEHARARAAGIEEDLEDAGGRRASSTCRCRPATSMSARATTCRG